MLPWNYILFFKVNDMVAGKSAWASPEPWTSLIVHQQAHFRPFFESSRGKTDVKFLNQVLKNWLNIVDSGSLKKIVYLN